MGNDGNKSVSQKNDGNNEVNRFDNSGGKRLARKLGKSKGQKLFKFRKMAK